MEAHAPLKKQNFRTSAHFFFLRERRLELLLQRRRRKTLQNVVLTALLSERLQPLSRGIQEQLKGDINEGSSAGDYSRSQWMKI